MSPPPPAGGPGTEGPGPSDTRALERRARYLADSPERVRELSAALGMLRAHDPGALEGLRRCFHDLAVSAGSHGLAEVAARCAAAGHAVAALTFTPLPIPRADLVTLEQHVLGVAEAFRLAQPRPAEPGLP